MSSLNLTIAEAHSLKGGKNDPFVTVQVKGRDDILKTDKIKGTKTPVWNTVLRLTALSDQDELDFEVLDWERIGNPDFLGRYVAQVGQLKALVSSGKNELWLKLQSNDKVQISTGELLIKFEFSPAIPLGSYAPPVAVATPSTSSASASASSPAGGDLWRFRQEKLVTDSPIRRSYVEVDPSSTETEVYVNVPGFANISQAVFVAGRPLEATVYFRVQEPRGILVRTLWITLVGEAIDNGKKINTIIKASRNLMDRPVGVKTALAYGKHAFTFSFYLPTGCPSSIKTSAGFIIRYYLSVDVDVVNLADEQWFSEIRVVNLNDTSYNREPIPGSYDLRRKSITKGSEAVEMHVEVQDTAFMPKHDVELKIAVNNGTGRKIKHLDVRLMNKTRIEKSKSRFDVHTTKNCVKEWKLKFLPPVGTRLKTEQLFILELPDLVHTLKRLKVIDHSYYLHLSLDIPMLKDLNCKIPIKIILPDPNVVIPVTPLDAVGRIGSDPEKWPPLSVNSWLHYVANLPQHAALCRSFDLTGHELLSSSDYALNQLAIADASTAEHLRSAVRAVDAKRVLVASFLKSLHLAQHIPTFEANRITYDILPHLNFEYLLRLNLPMGDAMKIALSIPGLTPFDKVHVPQPRHWDADQRPPTLVA